MKYLEWIIKCRKLGIFQKDIADILDVSKAKLVKDIKKSRSKAGVLRNKPDWRNNFSGILQEYLDIRDEHYHYSFTVSPGKKVPYSLSGKEKKFYKVLEDYLGMDEINEKTALASFESRWNILPRDGVFTKNLGYFRLLDRIFELGWALRKKSFTIARLENYASITWDKTCYDLTEENKKVESRQELLIENLKRNPRPKMALLTWGEEICKRLEGILEDNLKEREMNILKMRYNVLPLEGQNLVTFDQLGLNNENDYPVTRYADLGMEYDISRERTRQIAKMALEKLRASEEIHELKKIVK